MIYKKYFKRVFDIIFSLFSIIFFSPLLIILFILVKLKLGSPVIFRQKRLGYNSEVFTIFKFRTMTDKVDQAGSLLEDSKRLTNFGRILRSSSLDELPELFNILKGEMSFVGPRPLLEEYLTLYSEEQLRRHEVRPGLTGLAQINGRNNISWQEKFTLDVEYVDNISFFKDVKIIFETIFKVISREGINSDNLETSERFKGNINT